jgi:acetyl esterase/lipase
VAAYGLLALAVMRAWLTLNARYPIRRFEALIFPSFIAGWLTSELALHALVFDAIVAVALVADGALRAWPGWLGLAIMAANAPGLLGLWSRSHAIAPALEEALLQGLGTTPPLEPAGSLPPGTLLYPFARSHRAVRITRDLRYAPGAGRRHLLDVYAPAQGALTPAPVLLQIHGGGWFTGDKSYQAIPLLLHLARCGWVCVTANYRLSPRATFPDHLIDNKLALRWIREHIAEHGGDPDYVVVTGGSAGGHLAALLALTPNAPEYQPGFEHVDTRVRACVPLYGVYDLTDRLQHQRHNGLRRLVSWLVLKKRYDRDPDAFDRASPMSHVGPHAPPFFVIHGTHDNMASIEDARAFVALLRERSPGPVLFAEIAGAHHAFELFHSPRSVRVVHAVTRFLQTLHATHAAADPVASLPSEPALPALSGRDPHDKSL